MNTITEYAQTFSKHEAGIKQLRIYVRKRKKIPQSISNIPAHIIENGSRYDLDEFELQFLQLMAEDKTTQEISKTIFRGVRTLETWRQDIKKKLKVYTLTGMISKAISLNLITIDSLVRARF